MSLGQPIPVKSLQQDFQILRHALEAAHGGIHRYTTKAEMDRIFDQAYRKIDHPMTDLEFWRLAAPVVAAIKCGHTYLWFPETVTTQIWTMVKPILPNSKLELNFGVLTFYLDVNGYKYPDRGVMPDYPVAHTITDLLAGRDKDMELALSLARASGKGRKEDEQNDSSHPNGYSFSAPRQPPRPVVYFSGAFTKTGAYVWTDGMTLKDGIEMAGGFTEWANGTLRLIRRDGSQELYRLGRGRTLTNNPALQPEDIVLSRGQLDGF